MLHFATFRVRALADLLQGGSRIELQMYRTLQLLMRQAADPCFMIPISTPLASD